jgi:predicted MFS family arabinose efflux permease
MQRLAPTLAWSTALYGLYTYLGAGLIALNYQPDDLAHTISVYGAAGFAGALIGGRIADRLGPVVAMRAALIGLSACFILLYLAIEFERCVLPAVALTSLTAQIFFPAQQSRLLREFADRASTALAWNNSALFLGMTMGSLIGGQAMAAGGLTTILTLGASIALLAWATCVWRPIISEVPKISKTV